jgi:hypothetical protein
MDIETLGYIMKACIIMHNMIIEDEDEVDSEERFDDKEKMYVCPIIIPLILLKLSRHAKKLVTMKFIINYKKS